MKQKLNAVEIIVFLMIALIAFSSFPWLLIPMAIMGQTSSGNSSPIEHTVGFHSRGPNHWHKPTKGKVKYASGSNNVENPYAARSENGTGNPGDGVEDYAGPETVVAEGRTVEVPVTSLYGNPAYSVEIKEFRNVRDPQLKLELYTTNDPSSPIKTLTDVRDRYVADGSSNGGRLNGPIGRVVASAPGLNATSNKNHGAHMVFGISTNMTNVILEPANTSFELLQTNVLTARMVPSVATNEVTNYKFEVRFEDQSTWRTFTNSTSNSFNWVGRIVGDRVTKMGTTDSKTLPRYELKVTAQLSSGTNIESTPKIVSVVFPESSVVMNEPVVTAKITEMWEATKNYIANNGHNECKEYGFSVYLDARAGNEGIKIYKPQLDEGPAYLGTNFLNQNIEGVYSTSTNTPTVTVFSTIDSSPTNPLDGGFYALAWFHSHPLNNGYSISNNVPIFYSIPPGPSDKDTNSSVESGLIGYVHDYSSTINTNTKLISPSQNYQFGPTKKPHLLR